MTRRLACLLSTLGLVACSGLDSFYDKDYELYDGEKAKQGEEARQKAAAEQAADPKEQGAVGPEPAAAAATGASVAAKAVDPKPAATATPPADPVIARIFVLESVLDELNRAIRDGEAGLGDKRNEVERELAWRKQQAGAAWPAAQHERLTELRAFHTHQPPPDPAK